MRLLTPMFSPDKERILEFYSQPQTPKGALRVSLSLSKTFRYIKNIFRQAQYDLGEFKSPFRGLG